MPEARLTDDHAQVGRDRIVTITEVVDGHFYRTKQKERLRVLEPGDPARGVQPKYEEEHRWCHARSCDNREGFTIRQAAHMNGDGELIPDTVTGGGFRDYYCQDLVTGQLFVERYVDFGRRWQRVTLRELPKAMQTKARDLEPPSTQDATANEE